MIFTGCFSCLLLFAALSTHWLKYLGLALMESGVFTVQTGDILTRFSTGAGAHPRGAAF